VGETLGFTIRQATMYYFFGQMTLHNGRLYTYTFLYKLDMKVITTVTYINYVSI